MTKPNEVKHTIARSGIDVLKEPKPGTEEHFRWQMLMEELTERPDGLPERI